MSDPLLAAITGACSRARKKVESAHELLKLALPILEENASMTEHPDDAALVAEVKKFLGVE